MQWHEQTAEEVVSKLETDPQNGLSADEAARRLEKHGPNEILAGKKISPLRIFFQQFNDFLIYLLLAAAAVSAGVGFLPGNEPHYTDSILIVLIVLANGIFGFVQNYQAERAMEALRQSSIPKAAVFRDGEKRLIEATQIVPGDILYVSDGNQVPADARLVEARSLETKEAALTGESGNVVKQSEPLDAETPLAERSNLLFMNTDVVKGQGRAVVYATGMETEVGAIATEIQLAGEHKSPFQHEIDQLGRRIGYAALVVIAVVAGVERLATEASWITVLMLAVTLAVAAVPEGLPAVVTLTLARGSRRMAAKNARVRRLPVVESLGSVDTILTDKTGTLTENQMTVRKLVLVDQVFEVSGEGFSTEGTFRREGEEGEADLEALKPLLECGVIANDAEKAPDSEDVEYYGDPTEVALLISAAKAGVTPPDEVGREIGFSSERKRMTVIADGVAYMKGAPEVVLELCTRVQRDGETAELDDDLRETILNRNSELADQALRVLAFAKREVADPEASEEEIEQEMVFLGLQAMLDPPRAEVEQAVKDCRSAGIRVIMVTGDNLATAQAIGGAVGFSPEGALRGPDIDQMSDDELSKVVEEVEIFARVSPQHKVRLLKAVQGNGHRVAMTGDGVNDAPALRNADVGVAMGLRGTDVAQKASDMVLGDDNFATLRDAIAEGRGIFDNIRKFVALLLSANAGEIVIVFAGVLLGGTLFPETFGSREEALILTPVMLLWINLVTDGLPALALGADPNTPGVMERPPRPLGEPVLDRGTVSMIVLIGVAMSATGLPLFFYLLSRTGDLVAAQTALFTGLVLMEMVAVQLIRRRYRQPMFSNNWLTAAVASSVGLQLMVLFTPLRNYFNVSLPSASEWLLILAATAGFLVLSLIGSWAFTRSDGQAD